MRTAKSGTDHVFFRLARAVIAAALAAGGACALASPVTLEVGNLRSFTFDAQGTSGDTPIAGAFAKHLTLSFSAGVIQQGPFNTVHPGSAIGFPAFPQIVESASGVVLPMHASFAGTPLDAVHASFLGLAALSDLPLTGGGADFSRFVDTVADDPSHGLRSGYGLSVHFSNEAQTCAGAACRYRRNVVQYSLFPTYFAPNLPAILDVRAEADAPFAESDVLALLSHALDNALLGNFVQESVAWDLDANGQQIASSIAGFSTRGSFRVVTVVPEPQAWALMLAGLALLGFAARRRTAR